ncbi:unnamed protein product, partial [Urochloa humidicola]
TSPSTSARTIPAVRSPIRQLESDQCARHFSFTPCVSRKLWPRSSGVKNLPLGSSSPRKFFTKTPTFLRNHDRGPTTQNISPIQSPHPSPAARRRLARRRRRRRRVTSPHALPPRCPHPRRAPLPSTHKWLPGGLRLDWMAPLSLSMSGRRHSSSPWMGQQRPLLPRARMPAAGSRSGKLTLLSRQN